MNWLFIGALLGALAVVAGAFGAHGLEGRLDAQHLTIWHKAVHYHALHALALIVVGLLQRSGSTPTLAGWLMLFGILLFSGSLYGLALSGLRWLGMITPFGGLAFILGWLALAGYALRGATDRARSR